MADKKKEKLSESDLLLALAQLAQVFANTPGTQAMAESGIKNASNVAASEYQEKVAKEQEKAKKGGVFGTLGQIGGMALGNTLLPGVGGVVGAGLGGVAGHAAAGEEIDPMAAVFNMGLNAATQYALPKVQEAVSNATNPGDWSRVGRTARVDSRQVAEASVPEDAPLEPSPAPAQAPPPQMQPMYESGGIASAGGIPATTPTPAGGYWSHMVPPPGQSAPSPQMQPQAAPAPQGQAAPQMNVFDQAVSQTFPDYWNAVNPSQGAPGAQPGLQMNVNDQGLPQSLPMPGAQQAQAPQQDFVSRLATSIAQAVQQVGLPQMSVVRPNNPRVPRALDPQTASAIRNEGVQQDFQRAQLANQTAQTQATTANTQLSRDRFGYEQQRDTTTDQLATERFNKTTGLQERGLSLDERQVGDRAAAQQEELRLRAEEQTAQIAHMKVVEDQGYRQLELSNRIANKPSGGGGADNSLARERFAWEKQQAMSLAGNAGVRAQFTQAAMRQDPNTLQQHLDENVLGELYSNAAQYMADGSSMDMAVAYALKAIGGGSGQTPQAGNSMNTPVDANGKPIKRFDYSGNGSVVVRP